MGKHQSKIHKDSEIRKVYNLYEVLGKGSYASVRRGRKIKSGPSDRDVAVKVVKTSGLDFEEKEGLEEEIRILLDMDHPNIVKLHEVFISKRKKVYLVMELLQGGEMFERIIEERHFSEATAAFAMVQILDALIYCHAKEICHRDIKPENLFYSTTDKKSKLVIGDFGLSAQGEKLMETCCGTPQYVAPEVLQNKLYTNKVDCWSVGVVLYILLCGYPPFYAESNPLLYSKIIKEPFEFDPEDWEHISDEAKDLVRKLLTKNPERRPSAIEAKKHPWLVKAANFDKALGDKYLERMRRFKAVQRLRAGVTTMVAVMRMARIMNDLISESVKHESAKREREMPKKQKYQPVAQARYQHASGSDRYQPTAQARYQYPSGSGYQMDAQYKHDNMQRVFPDNRRYVQPVAFSPTQVRYAGYYAQPRYNNNVRYDQYGRALVEF